MKLINFVCFVFPDSNQTGNPKSGETHSLWSEGKPAFFIPFPHHKHIRVTVCHINLMKTFKWTRNVQGSVRVPFSSNASAFPGYLLSDRHFLTTFGLDGSDGVTNWKCCKLFGEAKIPGKLWQFTQGALTHVTRSFRGERKEKLSSLCLLGGEGGLHILSTQS